MGNRTHMCKHSPRSSCVWCCSQQEHEVFTLITSDKGDIEMQCECWLTALAASPYAYHLDDSPEDIIYFETNEPMFTTSECQAIRHNLSACEQVLGWGEIWEVYFEHFQKANPELFEKVRY